MAKILHPLAMAAVILAAAFALLIPRVTSAQGFGAEENATALNGTTLTYYPGPSSANCQADCAGNPNCKGFTWIQPGTYKPGDPAMCYLLSDVTGKTPARGHTSALKAVIGSAGARENDTSLNGNRMTYYPRESVDQCQADCANNPNCGAFTWIKAGAYNPGDAAMCYLLSTVTGRTPARGHISGLKGGGTGGTGGAPATVTQFSWVGRGPDKVQSCCYVGSDGKEDNQFKLVLDLGPTPTEIVSIQLYHSNANGERQDHVSSKDSRKWILAVFNNGTALNPNYTPPLYSTTLGTFSGQVALDLFFTGDIGGNFEGVSIRGGNYWLAEVVLGDGRTLTRLAQIP